MRSLDACWKAFACLVKTTVLREQIAQQIMRYRRSSGRAHSVFRNAPFRLPLLAIAGQQRPRLPKAAEGGLTLPSPPHGGNTRLPHRDVPACRPGRRPGSTPRSGMETAQWRGRTLTLIASPMSLRFSEAISRAKIKHRRSAGRCRWRSETLQWHPRYAAGL